MILTDENGRPFERPARSDYENDLAFMEALYAYKDAIRDCATKAFNEQWKKEVRSWVRK